MRFVSGSGLLRVLKPVAAGVALAYMATAWLDGPPPVNFQPENPHSAKQTEIVEPQVELVIERNIMKLGSLLSVKGIEPEGGADANELRMFFDPAAGADALPSALGVVESPDF